MTDGDTGAVAIALSDLRGSVDAGFARLNGRLDMSLQRTDQVELAMQELKGRVALLETKLWKFSLAAAAIGTGGATGVWQLLQ